MQSLSKVPAEWTVPGRTNALQHFSSSWPETLAESRRRARSAGKPAVRLKPSPAPLADPRCYPAPAATRVLEIDWQRQPHPAARGSTRQFRNWTLGPSAGKNREWQKQVQVP
ncbi:hypothetical protein P7K49_018394 [Saguinus oedipus]|uniref:Uncharacterized protein n=1 Tax=Saguinus oedipus TaxID=9490 RepID=A0ABQ9V592_SAGOE|nr:hypothetical protein P7K49_018394 [Saguinus oedipus]